MSEPIEVSAGVLLCAKVPHFFEDPDFLAYFFEHLGKGLATWQHVDQKVVDDYCDVFVSVDPSCCGEGAEADMPPHLWSQIVDLCRPYQRQANGNHIVVRLSPC